MSLIQITPPERAEGQLAETYREIQELFGMVPNAMQTVSASPQLLASRWMANSYFYKQSNLSPALQATIRLLVSEANDCAYCVDFNAAMLINTFEQTFEQVAATRRDPELSPLPEKEKAMLRFTLKSLHTPLDVTANDLATLHAQGWSDQDALDAVTLAANNRAADMILNTFKVERDF